MIITNRFGVIRSAGQRRTKQSSLTSSSLQTGATTSAGKNQRTHTRSRVVLLSLYGLCFCVLARLFYWQVIHRSALQAEAANQYERTLSVSAQRGRILTSDGYTLVDNQAKYRLFAQPMVMSDDPNLVARQLSTVLIQTATPAAFNRTQLTTTISATLPASPDLTQIPSASPAPPPPTFAQQLNDLTTQLTGKLTNKSAKWISLKTGVDENSKQQIEQMKIHGLGFDRYDVRDYPEASLAAHIVGFVGKDTHGNDQGYFGIEGAFDRELRGHEEKKTFLKDALGFHLLFGSTTEAAPTNGRDIVLTIRRDLQYAVEELLKAGMAKYGASAGEVIVMEPSTGKILAMASFPNYDPRHFSDFDPEFYKNPTISSTYEPGSIFKVLTVAGGSDAQVLNQDTVCTNCHEPRKIGSFTIKTWNNEYHPNITIADALAKSDNVAMIFAAELLGQDRFIHYIKNFGIGQRSGVELQEDMTPPFRKDWKPIDLATSSFGQGITVTGMQMVKAVSAIANGGKVMKPLIVEKVTDPVRQETIPIQPEVERQAISPEAAKKTTEMMVYAASAGEAKWIAAKYHQVAGKTGTAQIPIDGRYDEKKTIASFIGFAPANNPRFVMLVKLREPTSSPWAAETAAPLWYKIADALYLLLNISPDATPTPSP